MDCDNNCDTPAVLHTFLKNAYDIYTVLKKIKPNFTRGPDGIQAFFVKDRASCLCDPLCYLFNLIVSTATYPNQWKSAK